VFGVFDLSHEEVEQAIVGIPAFLTPYVTLHSSFCNLTKNTLSKKENTKLLLWVNGCS